MKRFAALYEAIDRTTSTNAKVAEMRAYFSDTPPQDAAWVLYFLTGQRPKRLLGVRLLAAWAMEQAQVPAWLFEDCYGATGDLAESIALILDAPEGTVSEALPLHVWVARLLSLRELAKPEQRLRVLSWWRALPTRTEKFLFVKLLTGELRVGVSQTLVMRAVADAAGLAPAQVAHRLMGKWEPSAEFFASVMTLENSAGDSSRPYPFFLAAPLETPAEALGPASEWQLEWKWDGIRGQLLRRDGRTFLWSRGEELITERFPEITSAALPEGTVLDGEVLAFAEQAPLPFAALQQRIGRTKLTPQVLAAAPVVFMAYDLLEWSGVDWRERPLHERRAQLVRVITAMPGVFRLSPVVQAASWAEFAALRQTARERRVEGLMLKRSSSTYGSGRKRGDGWKWKIDPFTVDAVLTYAQSGSGKRANLYSDMTFGLWHGGALVTIAKAYSGLSDEEIAKADKWVRAHTLERFGPVRQVEPVHVFELAFEGIALSPRHKSGVAVRFPRIARWRHDKPASEADTLDNLKALIALPRT